MLEGCMLASCILVPPGLSTSHSSRRLRTICLVRMRRAPRGRTPIRRGSSSGRAGNDNRGAGSTRRSSRRGCPIPTSRPPRQPLRSSCPRKRRPDTTEDAEFHGRLLLDIAADAREANLGPGRLHVPHPGLPVGVGGGRKRSVTRKAQHPHRGGVGLHGPAPMRGANLLISVGIRSSPSPTRMSFRPGPWTASRSLETLRPRCSESVSGLPPGISLLIHPHLRSH